MWLIVSAKRIFPLPEDSFARFQEEKGKARPSNNILKSATSS